MPDAHITEGQKERARRLREQIGRLQTGQPAASATHPSLREQIEERDRELAARELAAKEKAATSAASQSAPTEPGQ